jgi:nicotinate-nucleotide adenylyltransferase
MPMRKGEPADVSRVGRIGLLAGTFDPIHRAHLRLAAAAQEARALERIYFITAHYPWHKLLPRTPYADRYAMVALALADRHDWMPLATERLELPRGQRDHHHASALEVPASYTVDEVSLVQQLHPGARIHFLLGADSLRTISTWKDYRRLLSMCDFVVAARAGASAAEIAAALPPELVRESGGDCIQLQGATIYVLGGFDEPVSSTEVRSRLRLASGDDTDAQTAEDRGARAAASSWLRERVPESVVEYARRAGFYREPLRMEASDIPTT